MTSPTEAETVLPAVDDQRTRLWRTLREGAGLGLRRGPPDELAIVAICDWASSSAVPGRADR